MQHLVYVNGEYYPAREAQVPALDAGMQFGAGLFETLLAVDGKPHLPGRHLHRLRTSCAALGIPFLPTDDAVQAIIIELLTRSGLTAGEGRVKILVTPGDLAQYHTHREPTLLVTAEPYVRPPLHIPWTLMASDETVASPLAGHKSTSYFAYRHLLHRARVEGYDDVILLDRDGNVSETAIASLLLFETGRLILPLSPDRLPGITAAVIEESCRERGMDVSRRGLQPADLTAGAAVCICNSLLGIVPVGRIGAEGIPTLAPPFLASLREAWKTCG